MRTLIVQYLPRIPRSHSAKLLNHFKEAISSNSEVEELNLIQSPPPHFDEASLDAYLRRDYLFKELSDDDSMRLEHFDKLTEQFMRCDVVAMAFPMHNFSFPGIVKVYFDAVMLKEKTFTSSSNVYKGLMNGKKAITMSASGGPYLDPPNPWDHLTTLARVEFEFMGFSEIQPILAEGMNISEEYKERSLRRCYDQIDSVIENWYPGATTSRD